MYRGAKSIKPRTNCQPRHTAPPDSRGLTLVLPDVLDTQIGHPVAAEFADQAVRPLEVAACATSKVTASSCGVSST